MSESNSIRAKNTGIGATNMWTGTHTRFPEDLMYAAMRAEEKFPEFSDSQRLTFDNVKVGDIIRCLVWKRPLYAVVKRITKSGVGVDDLSLNMNGVKVEFYRKHEVNSTHKGT